MRFRGIKPIISKNSTMTEKEYLAKRKKVKELELEKEDHNQESYGTRTEMNIRELQKKEGEVFGVKLSDITPPIDTSPSMCKIVAENQSKIFKTKTESKHKTQARKINEEIRRDY